MSYQKLRHSSVQTFDFYTTEFNHLNNTNYRVKDLFCSICEKLFATRFYSDDDENICQHCFESGVVKDNTYENVYLQKQLAKAQFPCEFKLCDFKGLLMKFHEHSKSCQFGLVKDLFLKVKEIENRSLESLSTIIELNLNEVEKKTMLAVFKNFYFLVIIEHCDNWISIKVGQHLINSITPIKNFTVIYQNDQTEIKQKGEIHSTKELLMNTDSTGVKFHKALLCENVKVTVYFSDYEILKSKLNDCPVCFNVLVDNIIQCQNGHSFCDYCASKMANCPICREGMSQLKVNLKHLLPDHYFPCENFDEGCLELVKLSDRIEHDRCCAFKKLFCPECEDCYSIRGLYIHFYEKHAPFQNFCTEALFISSKQIADNVPYLSTIYIFYRSLVFSVETKFDLQDLELSFCVKQLGSEKSEASRFRYEVLLMHDDAIVARVGNVCICDEMSVAYNTKVMLEPCKKYFFSNESWRVRCQYNILFNY